MEFREVLNRRRMVRRFQQTPVPSDLIDRILGTLRHVPTAGFSQGIDVVFLDTPDAMERFWRTTGMAVDLQAAARAHLPPVIVLPFSDKRRYLERYSKRDKAGFGMHVEEGWPVPYWDVDAAMGVMTILLAAVDEGLGGWFFEVFDSETQLIQDLGVPEGPRLLGAIGLGYPDSGEIPFRAAHRQLDEYVHRGRW
jgi:nitroreductase